MLRVDQLPQCITGPRASVNAPMNTASSGISDSATSAATASVNSQPCQERSGCAAGARPGVICTWRRSTAHFCTSSAVATNTMEITDRLLCSTGSPPISLTNRL